MPAVFPNSVRVYTAKTDLVDTVLAEHVNLLQDEVTAVENTLGTGMLASSWSGTFSTPSTHSSATARLTNIEAGILSRAPLASPTLTGTPAAPTAAADTNTTQIATTAFVVGQAGSASPAMNGVTSSGSSLKFARQDHVHPTDSSRAPVSSPTFTGTPSAPTAAADDASTQLATTAFVLGQAGTSNPSPNGTASPGTSPRYSRQDHVHPTDTSRASTADLATRAPLASPALTGVPTAPTAAPGTATTQLATTAFVDASFLGKANASVSAASVSQTVVRNITISTSDPTSGQGAEGDVWLKTVS